MIEPAIGRNVRYVLSTGPNAGAARLGFITRVLENGNVSITCLPDASADGIGQIYIALNVVFEGEGKEPGTWHWPSTETV